MYARRIEAIKRIQDCCARASEKAASFEQAYLCALPGGSKSRTCSRRARAHDNHVELGCQHRIVDHGKPASFIPRNRADLLKNLGGNANAWASHGKSGCSRHLRMYAPSLRGYGMFIASSSLQLFPGLWQRPKGSPCPWTANLCHFHPSSGWFAKRNNRGCALNAQAHSYC